MVIAAPCDQGERGDIGKTGGLGGGDPRRTGAEVRPGVGRRSAEMWLEGNLHGPATSVFTQVHLQRVNRRENDLKIRREGHVFV